MARQSRYRRWTADTEIAFLLALRLYGNVARACAEIGRSTHGAQDRRRRMPGFDAKWQAMLDEWQAASVAERQAEIGADDPGVMPNRVRYDGFTPIRQRAFLRVLSETGSLEDACKRVGISRQAAIKMRRTYPSFQRAWDRAETHCAADLEQIAIERAIDGIEQEVAVGGQLVKRTVYPEGLMRKMIDVRERRTRDAARVAEKGLVEREHVATKAETDAILIEKLAAIKHRLADRRNAEARALWLACQAAWGRFGLGLAAPEAETAAAAVAQDVLPPLDEDDEGAMLRCV